MKILMTGGTGFIGRQLGKVLVQRGHEVIVLTRHPEKARRHSPFPARFYAWDGPKEIVPRAALENGVDAVAHLAGESIAAARWSERRKILLTNSRVKSTENLLKGFEVAGVFPQTFISASGIGYYGLSNDQIFDENSAPGGDFAAQLCVQWENEALKIKKLNPSTRVALLRIGLVLGEGGGMLGPLVPLFRRGFGAILGNGRQWTSWIDIDDLVRLWADALESEKFEGPYNAVAPAPVTNAEFTRKLADHLGTRLLPSAPQIVLRIILGEMSELLVGGTKAKSVRLPSTGFRFKCEDFASALEKNVRILAPGEQELVFEQWVPHRRAEIFPFFESELNLAEITPPWLRFKILGKSTPTIQIGTLIDYQLRLHGVPLKWRTEITHWVKDEMFIDRQLRGPYKKWVHRHDFEDLGSGTLMRDRITYAVPLGLLGRLLAGYYVAGNVNEIFGYRRGVIAERFGLS